ncbi:hypothetical protein AYI70_g6114 [Smittium culicis]|uniref:Transposon TX1 protein n=1 Tax=Smittium culicis TaxID=133412 RepID=A0A1R1XRR8_9FUNG|nr:hypothetical protein AYI70_g6114 [Smittium culicis]
MWNQYFSDLANDTTGNSSDPSKWLQLLNYDSDHYPECDNIISWADITTALNDTLNNKAPGADGVPSEIWKLVMVEKSPTSDLAKTILKIIKIMHETGNIPKSMTTSVVVPVPKKGDMKDTQQL